MAQIVHRVSYPVIDGGETRRVNERFHTRDGRRQVEVLTKGNPDARRYYDVRARVGGRTVTKSFRSRREADAYATTVEADKLRGVARDPRRGRVTLETFALQWIDGRHDLAEKTDELYRWLLEDHILPDLGSRTLGELTSEEIRSWHSKLSHKRYSTAAKAYRLLATILKTAVADDLIPRNPCQVKGASIERAPERPVATVPEVQALADAMPDDLRIAVLLAAWCQLRRGELLGLRRCDVDVSKGTVSVAVTRVVRMDGRVVTKPPKTTAGRRTVAIPPTVLPDVKRHLDAYVDAGPDSPVIGVSVDTLFNAWERARKKVGRTDLRLHDLRHTGLTLAAGAGATVSELMYRAGHASPVAALRYQHATRDRDRDLAALLGQMRGSGGNLENSHDNGAKITKAPAAGRKKRTP